MNTQSNFTIFYTDDDAEDREFFREVTESIGNGLELITLDNGQNLLDVLHNPPPKPHMIFLDINMPGLTGFDVLRELRTGKFQHLPVIMFTTSNDESVIEKSREMGANYFIAKSGHFPSLKKSIEHALTIDWSTFKTTSANFVYAA